MNSDQRVLLVGDNPFHGVSHLSLEKARSRGQTVTAPQYAAGVVGAALESGATGCLFSINTVTLDVLRLLPDAASRQPPSLYAIVPYTYEYVRWAVLLGGIPGLATKVAKEIALSGNWKAVLYGINGVVARNPQALLNAYMAYELSRVRAAIKNRVSLAAVLIHEIATDMALGLEMEWFFKAHVAFIKKQGLRPGFNTRNLPLLVRQFRRWGISLEDIALAAPFNAVGFQMCPSREACESALMGVPEAEVIGFSLLSGGYGRPREAAAYAASLPHLKGVALGVSRPEQARETFQLFREALG